jgi:hypothetical protein
MPESLGVQRLRLQARSPVPDKLLNLLRARGIVPFDAGLYAGRRKRRAAWGELKTKNVSPTMVESSTFTRTINSSLVNETAPAASSPPSPLPTLIDLQSREC